MLIRVLAVLVGGIASVALGGPPPLPPAVCGPVTVNTTWTAGAPGPLYIVTCDVRVLTGAVLTIEPGVTVSFVPGTSLVAEGGQVLALGTSTNPISFNSIDTTNRGAGLKVAGGQIQVDYGNFSGLQSGINLQCCGSSFAPPLSVNHSMFSGNDNGISGYTGGLSLIANSQFMNNTVAGGQAYQKYNNCTFFQNTNGFPFCESITFEDCEFDSHQTAISSPNGNGMVVRRCHIHDNVVGLVNVPWIERCSIHDNQIGVKIATPYLQFFQCNDIFQNDTYNVEMLTDTTLSAPNNWWGSSVSAQIDASIKDGFDQVGLGFLQYASPLSGEWSETSTCACTVPVFNVHPLTQSVYSGNTATFTANATATGTPTYLWLRNGVPLTNSFRVSGVNTPTLTITPVAREGSESNWTDAGQYVCRATNVCGITDSNPATLTTPICAADFNASGMISVQDIFDFLAAYFAGCP